jgi:hypothetical protein
MNYKSYLIEIVEVPPGQWRAHIRRQDNQPISTEPYGPKMAVLVTNAFFSAGAALDEAKRAIDGGGMK